jgi:hypothetical protein
VKAGVVGAQLEEAAHEETGADEEDEREGDLGDHQHRAKARARAIADRPAPSAAQEPQRT